MGNPIETLHTLGQSIWYDNIERRLLEGGQLAELIAQRVIRGVTSNPTIFQKAIETGRDYDNDLRIMARRGYPAETIFEELAVADIQAAADLFQPVYEETEGLDGYVSLEVNPHLAQDSERTITEAKRLWEIVDRPNLMVKIPATLEGLPAVTQSISDGINVNVTLIFSLTRYGEVIEAFLKGIKRRLSKNEPVEHIASVASFFVSRVDTKVDQQLEKIVAAELPEAGLALSLQGKSAVANAVLAYGKFRQVFDGVNFDELRSTGVMEQRPLWASTSTKNPVYSDVKYVEELILPRTVNTMPPHTLDAFRHHGTAKVSIGDDVHESEKVIADLEEIGIFMEQVTLELETEGVKAFADSYDRLVDTIERRRKTL